jgi:hypothetical protein
MGKFLRLAAGVLCVGMLALGAVFFDPTCLSNFPHRWDPDKKNSIVTEIARKEELDQREDAIRRRRQAKEQVAKEVIARRNSLAEAIELFRALDQDWPENHSGPRTPEDFGVSPDEWDGRAVLDSVRLVLDGRPDDAAAVASRLEKELQQLLADRKKRRPAPADPRIKRNR